MIRALWRRSAVLVLCTAAGLIASAVILSMRLAAERAYQTVELTIDGDDWTALARLRGAEREALYRDLYRRGVRSVTIYAASLRRLSDAGLVSYMAGSDALNAARAGTLGGALAGLAREGRLRPDATYVQGAPPVLALIRDGFTAQRGAGAAALLRGSGSVLEVSGRGRDLEDASLGVLPGEVAAARAAHLAAEVRVRNFREVAPGGLGAFFAGLRGLDQRLTLIFDRDQVLGYDELIPDVAAEMTQSRFVFGRIESFTARRKQKGEDRLARLVAPEVIRVFSLSPEELAGVTPEEARDKFVLAARERNVRILYLRPFVTTSAGLDPVAVNLEYVESIASDLTRAGFKVGKAAPLPPVAPRVVWLLGAALGALAATALAVTEVAGEFGAEVSPRWSYGGVGLGLVITAGALAAHHATLWRQILALAAALAFPTLAMLFLVPRARRETTDLARPTASMSSLPAAKSAGVNVMLARSEVAGRASTSRLSWVRLLGRSLSGLWIVSAASALGGIVLTALLTDWAFMMEMREFLGVKIAQVLPVVLIGLLITAAVPGADRLGTRLRAWLRQPLLLGYGVAIIVIGVAAVFALGRTGNAGLPLASSLELKTRILLQHVLVARPRTKEFLIGHPAMMLAFALAALGARRWVLPAAVLGAVGQVGLVNSFSHIHTPLVYVVLRTVYALVIGSILGGLLVSAVWWTRRWWWAPPPAPGGRGGAYGPDGRPA